MDPPIVPETIDNLYEKIVDKDSLTNEVEKCETRDSQDPFKEFDERKYTEKSIHKY